MVSVSWTTSVMDWYRISLVLVTWSSVTAAIKSLNTWRVKCTRDLAVNKWNNKQLEKALNYKDIAVWKRVIVQHLSDKNEFHLHESDPVGGTGESLRSYYGDAEDNVDWKMSLYFTYESRDTLSH